MITNLKALKPNHMEFVHAASTGDVKKVRAGNRRGAPIAEPP
jgi:hypothetical protein